jgi:helix-turn-helix, Psq domain
MSAPPTVDEIGAARELALAQLSDLERQRRELSLDVVLGSPEATGRMEGLDMQVRSLKARLSLIDMAEQTYAEEQAAEAERAAAAEQARLEGEAERLTRERDAAMRGVHAAGTAAGRAVAEAVRIDDELAVVNDQLGRRSRSIRGVVGELVGIAVRDESGVEIERVMNFRRKMLLDEYVLGEEAAVDEPAAPESKQTPSPACSICGHPKHAEIEAALSAGTSLREAAERYGVSRSALSRHRQHKPLLGEA